MKKSVESRPVATAAIAFAALCAAVPFAANADTTRIRHLADTYLRSDGTQLIDTGYIASTNMRVEVEFTPEHAEFTAYTDYLWGSFASGMRYGNYIQCNNASSRNGVVSFSSGADGNVGWQGGDYPATRSRFKTVFDYPNRTIETWSGDAKVFTDTTKDPGFESAGTSVVLFGSRSGSSASPSFKGRVYSFKIYDKGVLVRDMVPYGRGAVTGMLDRCSSKVYVSARGNPFVLGTDDGTVRSHRGWANGQIVDTGYCMTPQTKIELDFALADPTTAWSSVFGALAGAGLACGLGVSSGDFMWSFADGDGSWVRTGIARDTARHTITLDGPNSTVTLKGEDGTVQYTATMTSTRTNTSDVPLRLFGAVRKANGSVSVDSTLSVRIYGMKIWNGDTLARNYEPRVIDNVEGLYDTVNDTFNTPILSLSSDTYNARLTAGGDIECASASGNPLANSDAYLQAMGGSAAIETGVTLTRSSRIESDLALNYLYGTINLYGTSANYLYFQRNNGERTLAMGNYWAGAGTTTAELGRYRHDIDFGTGSLVCTRPDGTTAASTLNATKLGNNLPSATTLALMAQRTASGYSSAAYMRLYGFRLYEGDALAHDYVPCAQNGVAGLWDTVDRVFFANARSADGSGFTLGGAGANGGGMAFTEQPLGGHVSEGESITLTAFAPGAVGYLWLKNGEIVEGESGRTLVVPWARGAGTDTYQCVSHYTLFGYGLSAEAQVENLPSGTVLYVR